MVARRTVFAVGEESEGPVSRAVLRADALLVGTLYPILARRGLTVEAFRALRVLADSPGMTVGELGRGVGANPPATTRIVDRLVTEGLAYRRADEVDRRRVLVMISDDGATLFRDVLAEIDRSEADPDLWVKQA